MADSVAARLSPAEGRRFAFTVGAALLVLGGIVYWRGGEAAGIVLGSAGILLAVGGVVAPGRLTPVHRAWMGLARLVSRITTPIVLGLVYFLAITPTGVARRLLGLDALKRSRGQATFWVERTQRRSDLERQF